MMNEPKDRMNILRKQRQARNWTQAYIAEKIGCDVKSVSRWEQGHAFPSRHHRQQLCALYEKSAKELGFLGADPELELCRDINQEQQEEQQIYSLLQRIEQEAKEYAAELDIPVSSGYDFLAVIHGQVLLGEMKAFEQEYVHGDNEYDSRSEQETQQAQELVPSPSEQAVQQTTKDKPYLPWPGGDDRTIIQEMLRDPQSEHWYKCREFVKKRVQVQASNIPRDLWDDIIQYVMIRIYTSLSTFQYHSAFRTWIFAVIRNCIIDVRRHAEQFKILPDDSQERQVLSLTKQAFVELDSLNAAKLSSTKPTSEESISTEPPFDVFISYASQDQAMLKELSIYSGLLQRQNLIRSWYERRIELGAEWRGKIDEHLNTAHIILLLISVDFMDSSYCYDVEFRRALERHERGEATVIPIILRPVDWRQQPFAKLQALPSGAEPVVLWGSRDEAYSNIVEGIRDLINNRYLLRSRRRDT